MKVREILLELSEVLDRHSYYGAWIDANTGKVYPIKEAYGHLKFINHHKTYGDLKIPPSKPNAGYLTVAFYNNLIRVAHDRAHEMNIQGNGEDLQKAARILIASIVQPDVDSVYINKAGGEDNRFGLPEDRRAAIQFINAG
jgi:hypothetical protein